MKAILTKYHGPTDHKGSRIGVKAEGLPKKYYPWDYSLDVRENHQQAARKFALKYDWLKNTKLMGGSTPDGYVFVMIPKNHANGDYI